MKKAVLTVSVISAGNSQWESKLPIPSIERFNTNSKEDDVVDIHTVSGWVFSTRMKIEDLEIAINDFYS
jgi:hypothetical protein